MRYFKVFLFLVVLSSLQGCFTVGTKPNGGSCELLTKELTLDLYHTDNYRHIAPQTMEGAVVVLGASAVTLIVSGSIVVMGNAVHWVEKQGRCNSNAVETFTKKETQSLIQEGAKPIQTPQELESWAKEQTAKKKTS